MGIIAAELEPGTDTSRMLDDIKAAVDRIETFPAETEKPVVMDVVRRNQVIDVVVFGDVPEKTLKVVAEQVRDDLRATPGISQVELSGVRVDEISIEVPERSLREHGLTFAGISGAVRRASLDMPGGSVRSEDGEILVRTKGLKYRGSEYADIPVLSRADGTQLKTGGYSDDRRRLRGQRPDLPLQRPARGRGPGVPDRRSERPGNLRVREGVHRGAARAPAGRGGHRLLQG